LRGDYLQSLPCPEFLSVPALEAQLSTGAVVADLISFTCSIGQAASHFLVRVTLATVLFFSQGGQLVLIANFNILCLLVLCQSFVQKCLPLTGGVAEVVEDLPSNEFKPQYCQKKKKKVSKIVRYWWHTPVILATQEADIKSYALRSAQAKKSERPIEWLKW
jgi:hypothetical protein